ncbi:MAG: hypothetical protein WD334_11025 [Chitinophagales bacterium]
MSEFQPACPPGQTLPERLRSGGHSQGHEVVSAKAGQAGEMVMGWLG